MRPWDAREAPISRQLVGQLEGADAHATPYRAGGLDAVAGRRVLDGVPTSRKQPVVLTPAENGPGERRGGVHVVPLGALRHPDAVQVIQAKGVVQQLQHDREHGRVDLQRRWWGGRRWWDGGGGGRDLSAVHMLGPALMVRAATGSSAGS